MNTAPDHGGGQTYYLTDLLGSRITSHGKKIGKLEDLVIVETEPLPQVTKLEVKRRFGDPSLLIPIEKVKLLKKGEIVVSVDDPKPFEGQPQAHDILLKDHILDKKVLDKEDRDVEVVYDVRITAQQNRLVVTHVNISRYRFLRRTGPRWLAKFIYSFKDERRDEKIPWQYIQPLPMDIGSFRGDVKLKVLKEMLADIHPADIADILEEVDPSQRVVIFNQLESERASDTLEEIDPSVQREIVPLLPKVKAAELLSKMTPGQAADVLSVLPHSEKKALLHALRPHNESLVRKVGSILDRQEEQIANYTTTRILRVHQEITVAEAREYFNTRAKDMMVIMYLYVTDHEGKLLGVLDLRELLHASPTQKLRDVMIDLPVVLKQDSTLKEAMQEFTRYEFRALPVVDGEGKLLGAVPYRDIMNLKHRFIE